MTLRMQKPSIDFDDCDSRVTNTYRQTDTDEDADHSYRNVRTTAPPGKRTANRGSAESETEANVVGQSVQSTF